MTEVEKCFQEIEYRYTKEIKNQCIFNQQKQIKINSKNILKQKLKNDISFDFLIINQILDNFTILKNWMFF